ncbi:MAG: hypothetical protein JWM47_272 [Acidimicrobiales bacterium]|nr:hypothetical protein [Acidimicrobiales bacterium]
MCSIPATGSPVYPAPVAATEEAPARDHHPPTRPSRRRGDIAPTAYRRVLALATLVGVWLTRHGMVANLPAGVDVEGHVARTDWAFHLWGQGRLDGWFPTFGSGYRLFAVYGPGLAIVSGLIRVLSLGLLDTPRSLSIVGVISIASLPWAAAALSRALGSTRLAAALHGMLALTVSVPFGGGLSGLYSTGLVPQALAFPIQVAALAAILRLSTTGSRRSAAAVAALIGGLLLLHPISVAVLALMAVPLVLLCARPSSLRHGAALVGGLAWAAAIAAFWLLPALHTLGLRGGVSAWGTPPLPTRLAEVGHGRILFPRGVAYAVGAAIAITLGEAIRTWRGRRRLAAPLVAFVYLVGAHLAVGHQIGRPELRIQFANRGLALAGILALLPLAAVIDDLIATRPRRQRTLLAFAAMGVLAVAVPVWIRQPLDPGQASPPPSADLVATARALHQLVPPGARHLWAQPSPFVPLGTDHQARWLAVTSHTNTAHLYFPEATEQPAAGLLPDPFLRTTIPADGLGPLRRAGITHVVVTYPDPGSQLDGAPGYHQVRRIGTIAIYAVEPDPDAPSVATLLQPAATPIVPVGQRLSAHLDRYAPESLAWTATASQPLDVVAAVAYDPDWQVTVDDRRVATQPADGLVRFGLPAGRHHIGLRFTGSRNDPIAILISLVALGAAGWVVVSGVRASRRATTGRGGTPADQRSAEP